MMSQSITDVPNSFPNYTYAAQAYQLVYQDSTYVCYVYYGVVDESFHITHPL